MDLAVLFRHGVGRAFPGRRIPAGIYAAHPSCPHNGCSVRHSHRARPPKFYDSGKQLSAKWSRGFVPRYAWCVVVS
ncbi:unnamed protein product, partial [Iphiclides podalirius]